MFCQSLGLCFFWTEIFEVVPGICWSFAFSLGVTALSALKTTKTNEALTFLNFSIFSFSPWHFLSLLCSIFLLQLLETATSITAAFFCNLLRTKWSDWLAISSLDLEVPPYLKPAVLHHFWWNLPLWLRDFQSTLDTDVPLHLSSHLVKLWMPESYILLLCTGLSQEHLYIPCILVQSGMLDQQFYCSSPEGPFMCGHDQCHGALLQSSLFSHW